MDKRFLINSDQTGRFILTSTRTGKKYFVEPISSRVGSDHGDINPATKKLEGTYGHKYKGAVRPEESLVTEENFDVVHELGVGQSPISYIEALDDQYFNQRVESNL